MIEAEQAMLEDHEARRAIETDLDTTMLVEAAAGTGKTTSMIGRMVALLAEGKCEIGRLAAVTFTRKATAELRERFGIALERAARRARGPRKKRLADALENIEQCFIGTIHSFCGRLLRERPIEANVDVAFQELDEDEEFRLRTAAWDEYAARMHAAGDPLIARLDELGLDLERLREAYVGFADYPDVDQWPVTTVEIDEALVERARSEIRRVAEHAAGLDLPRHAEDDELIPFYRDLPQRLRHTRLGVLSELMTLLEDCCSVNSFRLKSWPGGQDQGRRERDRWEAFRDGVAAPLVDRWRQLRYGPVLEVLRGAAGHYGRMRATRGVLSYQDLLMHAAALLADKPHVRRYFRERFSHLLVDEFQDTDPVQARVMMLLTADDDSQADWRRCRPRRGSLFVVGDPKQSIYRFRRADIVTYDQVRRIIEQGGRVVELTTNFRSVGPLIEWFNGVSPDLFPSADDYGPGDVQMACGRDGDPGADLVGVRRLHVPKELGRKKQPKIEYEAEVIAATVRDAIDRGLTVPRRGGAPTPATPGDFMVLTRSRSCLATYARKLEARGVPVVVTGGTAVNDVAEVRLLHALLAAVVEPDNPVALVGALRGELFGISDDELYRYRSAGGRFNFHGDRGPEDAEGIAAAFERLRRHGRWMNELQPVAAIERVAVDVGLVARASAAPGGAPPAGALAKAIELLRAAQAEHWSAVSLVEYLGTLIDPDRSPPERHDAVPLRPHEDAVRVMNLHQAKGLEAPVVFLAEGATRRRSGYDLHIDREKDAVGGYLAVRGPNRAYGRSGPLLAAPVSWDQWEAEEQRFRDAEDNRLLYVAATRAGAQLVVCSGPCWGPLVDAARDRLAEPEPRQRPPAPAESLPPGAPAEFASALADRWARLRRPTYDLRRAKEIAVRGRMRGVAAGEHGTEWGTVVHVLLEAAAARPGADLRALAESALVENDLDPALVAEALGLVRSVTESDLWRRARAAASCLTEVPIQYLEPGAEVETIVRGVIDLVFREPAGWVIVDYKTDDSPGRDLDELVTHYGPQVRAYAEAWERLTGEPVAEGGLLFVRTGAYRTVLGGAS